MRKISIQQKIVGILIICFFIPFLLQTLKVNVVVTRLIQDKVLSAEYKNFENSALHISSVLQSQLDFANYYRKNEWIENTVSSLENADEEKKYQYQQILQKNFVSDNNIERYKYPYYFILLDYKGNMLTNYTYTPHGGYPEIYQDIVKEEWFKKLQNSYTETAVMFTQKDFLGNFGMEKFYVAVNLVYEKNIGVLIIGTDESSIVSQSYSVPSEREVYIVDEEGKCIIDLSDTFDENTEEIFSKVKSEHPEQVRDLVSGIQVGNDIILNTPVTIKGYYESYSLTSIIPADSLTGDIKTIKILNSMVLVLYVAAILWVIVLLRKSVVKPIRSLGESVNRVKEGNLDVKVERMPSKELDELGEGFNAMTSHLKRQFEDIRFAEEEKRVMEFRMLQSQIKPHFVRNVLNTIRWLAEINGVSSVGRAVMALSSLLEYNFQNSEVTSTVGEELQYVRTYLYLQKLRFQNKFEDQYYIDEELLSIPLLKLSLQPIVENSIYHGMLNKNGLGLIVISCKRRKNAIEIVIRDNGVGMTQEQAEQILQPPTEKKVAEAMERVENIALWNVDQRIKRKYGNQYGLTIESFPGEGTCVTIKIPLEVEKLDKNSDYR